MGSFSAVPLVSKRILSVRLEGSLTLDDVARLRLAQRAAIEMVQWEARQYDLIVDTGDSRIQDGAIAKALDALRMDPQLEPRRMAFVHGDSPAKMQVRRLAAQRGDGVFSTSAEALAWLES